MAKVIAPFKIIGTLDDLNFYIDDNNVNLVRTKGKTGVSSEQFKTNPIFTKIRNHGNEFGHCAQIAHTFRMLANQFNEKAKDGSFAGRANKLLFEILQEDTTNEQGKRTVANGLDTTNGKEFLIGFEGNKLRPLETVLKTKWYWDKDSESFKINLFNPLKHLDWPEKATHVHLAVARTNWDYIKQKISPSYSTEHTFSKESATFSLEIKPEIPTESNLHIIYLYIGFSTLNRKKMILLKRAFNTVTIIKIIDEFALKIIEKPR